jgi:phage terminase small subunit
MSKPLTTKQRAFVEHYLSCWNVSEAARRAGYANPYNNGHRLMEYDGIKAAIATRLTELKMGADEVLARLSDHASGSLRPFIRRGYDGELRGFDLSDEQPLHLVHKVSLTTRTMKDDVTEEKISIELYDAQAALALLGRHHRLFADKIEHSGADGAPLFPDFEKALQKTYADDSDPPTTDHPT